MKARFSLLTVFVIFISIFVACKNEPPLEDIARKYLQLVNENKLDEAMEMGTENTRALLKTLKNLRDSQNVQFPGYTIKDLKCKREGKRAECRYCCDASGEEGIVWLVQTADEQWLVDVVKEEHNLDSQGEGLYFQEAEDETATFHFGEE